MNILDFEICNTLGFLKLVNLIKILLNVICYVTPIILIIMTIMDLVKNVINPSQKDGMKKITSRAIACVIVFLVPTFIRLFIYLIGVVTENSFNLDYTVSTCYTNANKECIQKLEDYLYCDSGDDSKTCEEHQNNEYTLDNNCNITMVAPKTNNNNNNNNSSSSTSKSRQSGSGGSSSTTGGSGYSGGGTGGGTR